MILVKQVNKSYGALTVLSNVSFALGRGQRAALVGPNGVGKSTLLKIIAGLEEPDSGQIELLKNVCLGYLPQELEIGGNKTVADYLRQSVGIQAIEERMCVLEPDLTDPEKLAEYADLQQVYERLGGSVFEYRMKTVLAGFGLNDIATERSLVSLSGGQKSKVALSGILLKGVDVLLLDEPTNNLDLPALVWLENFLLESDTTCLIVSHDRRFLDNVVSRVFEIEWFSREVTIHSGSYTEYLEYKAREIRRRKEQYRLQQEEIARLQATARTHKAWARSGAKQEVSDHDKFIRGARRDRSAKSAKRSKALEKKIEQMEKAECPKEREPLVIPLVPQKSEAAHSIKLDGVVAGYKNGFQIGPIDLEMTYGSRVGILGINGCGKSTLLKVITGEMKPKGGRVIVGPSLVIGNLMQEHENLPREETLIHFLTERGHLTEEQSFRLLSRFNFEADEATKRICELSPGGRARLLLALFSAISANVLVLDEPTNHLDLEATEALKEVLASYEGTVLLVSHDRYFLERARLTHTLVLSDGKLESVQSYEAYADLVTANAKRLLKHI